jgi:hypothetical protein
MTQKTLNIEELIECVKAHPIIYDRSGHQKERNEAFEVIAKKLEMSPIIIKNKWRNVRDMYLRAMKSRKNYEEMNKLHLYTEYKHEAKLNEFLYHQTMDEILGGGRRGRKRASSHTIPIYPRFKTVKTDSGETAIVYRVDMNQEAEFLEEEEESSEYQEPSQDLINNEKQNVSGCNHPQIESTNEPPSQSIIKSDIDVWFESIKSSFLKLNKINQAKARRDINNTISNYEIEQLTTE